MNGGDFIAFAGKIAAMHREEAGYRSAVSRAYYGAFHLAKQFLEECRLPLDARHENVAIDLKESGVTDAIVVGRMLDALRSARVSADYRVEQPLQNDRESAMFAVERAHRVRELLSVLRTRLEAPETREAFVQAVRAYRQRIGRRG